MRVSRPPGRRPLDFPELLLSRCEDVMISRGGGATAHDRKLSSHGEPHVIVKNRRIRCGVGGVSPLLFFAAFSYAPYPDRPRRPYALFWLAPAGIHRFIGSRRYVQRVNSRNLCALLALRLGRFITDGGACRFCVIAMTLATRTCMRLRTWSVGGLSSAARRPPSAALSLSS